MKRILFLTFLVIFQTNLAIAFSFEDGANLKDIMPMLEVSEDAISWDIIATTKEDFSCTKKDGLTDCYTRPIYSKEVKALDEKEVVLMGYMFPLEQSQMQKRFLIGPYPPNCPFEYHTGPSRFIEVVVKKPIKFSFDPISVKGKFLVKYNEETEVFYYLEDAKKI